MTKVPGDGEEPLDGNGKDCVEGARQTDLGHRKQEGNQQREDLHISLSFLLSIFCYMRIEEKTVKDF